MALPAFMGNHGGILTECDSTNPSLTAAAEVEETIPCMLYIEMSSGEPRPIQNLQSPE